MWNGDKKDLRKVLDAHKDHFAGWLEHGVEETKKDYEFAKAENVTPEQVIDAICSVAAKKDEYNHQPRSAHSARFKREWTRVIAQLQKYMDENHAHFDYMDEIQEFENLIADAGKYAFVVTVGFGDHHGDFCDNLMGTAMDHEGCKINIRTKTLRWTTLNNH